MAALAANDSGDLRAASGSNTSNIPAHTKRQRSLTRRETRYLRRGSAPMLPFAPFFWGMSSPRLMPRIASRSDVRQRLADLGQEIAHDQQNWRR
jgi:hypothetical protein